MKLEKDNITNTVENDAIKLIKYWTYLVKSWKGTQQGLLKDLKLLAKLPKWLKQVWKTLPYFFYNQRIYSEDESINTIGYETLKN